MVTPIVMPKFGQMTEESAIVEWLKKEGDTVDKGDILFTVETDKSVMEVESFSEGTLLKIAVAPGVSVPVQSVVGYLGRAGRSHSRDAWRRDVRRQARRRRRCPARTAPAARLSRQPSPAAAVPAAPSSPLRPDSASARAPRRSPRSA